MKTVLAPNAPWPKVEPEIAIPKPKPKRKPKPGYGKRTQTDRKFEEWLAKGNA